MMCFRHSLCALALFTLCCVTVAQEPDSSKSLTIGELTDSQLAKLKTKLIDFKLRQSVLTQFAADGTRQHLPIESVSGKSVRVEGLVWGGTDQRSNSPNAGPHVVYDGGSVFVKGPKILGATHRGKIVRVSGVLRRVTPPISRIPGKTTRRPDYYYIQAERVTLLDAVKDPHLVLNEPRHDRHTERPAVYSGSRKPTGDRPVVRER